MEIYKKIIDLIYPGFEKPSKSRFNKFFEENENRQFEDKKLQLNGHKIYTGEDKRTTILIKNIPKNMTKNQFKMVLEKIANINYIYIPLFMLTRDNLRCAFVNVVNSKSIIDIYLKLRKINFIYDNPNTKIEISYSNLQGRKALIDNFREERNIFKKKNINTFF
jgi:protein phosphatase 1 regulatory subunit 42